jgi:hypothetical protein
VIATSSTCTFALRDEYPEVLDVDNSGPAHVKYFGAGKQPAAKTVRFVNSHACQPEIAGQLIAATKTGQRRWNMGWTL